jgi:hypothetical protein
MGRALSLGRLAIAVASLGTCGGLGAYEVHRIEMVVRFGGDVAPADVTRRLEPLKVSDVRGVLPRRGHLYDVVVETELPADQALGQVRRAEGVVEVHPRLRHRYEFVVQFAGNIAPAEAARRLEPLKVLDIAKVGRYHEVVVETDLSAEDALGRIRRAPGVELAEPNVKYYQKRSEMPGPGGGDPGRPLPLPLPDGPSLDALPGWLREHLPPDRRDRELRIALVGSAPDASDPRLRPDGRFRLSLGGSNPQGPSPADTEQAAWLRAAWPRMHLIAIPVPPGAGRARAGIARAAIERALVERPQVLCVVPGPVPPEPAESSELMEGLGRCWEESCLPLLVTRWRRAPVLPGLLTVSIVDDRQWSLLARADVDAMPDQSPALVLPRSLLGDRARVLDPERAGAAYMALAAAALPIADEPLPHLDRASRLVGVGPVFALAGDGSRLVRILDLNAGLAPNEALKVDFIGKTFPWDQRVDQTREILDIQDLFDSPDEDKRRILTRVYGDVRLRHLGAIAQVLDSKPILLAPLPSQGVAYACFRLRERPRPGVLGLDLRLLRSLSDARDECKVFSTILQEMRIEAAPARD